MGGRQISRPLGNRALHFSQLYVYQLVVCICGTTDLLVRFERTLASGHSVADCHGNLLYFDSVFSQVTCLFTTGNGRSAIRSKCPRLFSPPACFRIFGLGRRRNFCRCKNTLADSGCFFSSDSGFHSRGRGALFLPGRVRSRGHH